MIKELKILIIHFVYSIALLTLFSCGNKDTKDELKNAYEISAKDDNDTLKISYFKVLRKIKVNHDYTQRIKVNNLNKIIDLNQMRIDLTRQKIELLNNNIENRKYLVELNDEKKAEYQADLEYGRNRLNKAEISIREYENEITILHQEIVLINARFNDSQEKNFELIEYVFSGDINGKSRIDTMSILFTPEHKFNFIKNDMYTDYKGE